MLQPRVSQVQVVHDEAVVRVGVVALLDAHVGLAVSACGDAAAWLSTRGSAHDCDVAITDHATGLKLAARGDVHNRPRILVLTHLEREWEVRAALEAGVQGYLLQRCNADELVAAVRAVSLGAKYLAGELATRLAAGLMHDELTSRELQVLRAMSTGASNKAISQTLGIADATVKAHVRAILHKVGAAARTEAVAIAARRGLISA